MILNVLAQTKQAQRSLDRLSTSIRGVGASSSLSDKTAAASAAARAATEVAAARKRELADARAAATSEAAKVQQIRSDQRAANSAANASQKRAAAARAAAQAEELGAVKTQAALARSNLASAKAAATQEAAAAKLATLQTAAATRTENVTRRVQVAYMQRGIAAQKAAVAEAQAGVISAAANARAIAMANQLANVRSRASGQQVSAATKAQQQLEVLSARQLTDDARKMASGSRVALTAMQNDARTAASALRSAEAIQARNTRAIASDNARVAAARAAATRIELSVMGEAVTAANAAVQKIKTDQMAANAALARAGQVATAERLEAQARTLGAAQAQLANARIAVSDAQRASAAATADSRDANSALRAAVANEAAAARIVAANERMAASNAAASASATTMWGNMAKQGSKAQWIGRQLTSNLSLPILALTGIGVAMGVGLEKAMTRVTKVYGDATKGGKEFKNEIKALEGAFIALSNQYGVQSDEVANIAADWAAAGSSGLALAKQTKLTLQTMVLGEMDAAEATKTLIAIQAQWGASTEDNIDRQNAQGKAIKRTTSDGVTLTGILRQLNAVENETGTTMADLTVAYGRASAMARTAGVSTGELAAMVSALVPAAGTAETAGNGLKTMLSRIMAPTSAATEIMGLMGINLDKAGWASMNATQRMEAMAKGYVGLTGEQKAMVDATVVGRYQLNRFGQMMTEMANPMGYYHRSLELLKDEAKVAKIAQEELNTVLDSSPQKFKQVGVIIQNSLLTAMQPLIPVFLQLSQWMAKVFKAFSDLDPKIRGFILVILLLLSVLGPVILVMGLMKLAISQLAPMFFFLGRMILLPLAPLKLLARAFMLLPAAMVLAGKGLGLAVVAAGRILVGAWATMKAITIAGLAAWRAVMGATWAATVIGWYVFGSAMHAAWITATLGMTAIQKAAHVLWLATHKVFWMKLIALTGLGSKGVLAAMKGFGKKFVALLASPWVIAIMAIIALIAMFHKQIVQAFNNVVDYFQHMPDGIKKALSPIGNLFVSIKNIILKAFNALPEGVKNALLAVVRIVHAAAMKIYELFSYINPFAHHSPSLVENVTAGMAAVNAQFSASAEVAEKAIGRMHRAINSLRGASASIVADNTAADDQKMRDTAVKAGQGAALPAYDGVKVEVESAQAALESLNGTIKRQTALVESLQSGVDAYDKKIDSLNKSLQATQEIQDSVNRALSQAQTRYDRFAGAQIAGMGAAEDAAFANEQAQKRLQLQIKKMESESGSVDNVTDAYSKLQGQIELLMGKQAELRNAGAGSDILGPYDKMIADLKAKQAGLGGNTATGPAAEIAKLNTALEKLQRQAEVMDLEKSLKFDGLNRNIEKLKSNVEEMPYGEIMAGLDSSKISVDSLTFAYDTLGQVMNGQQMQIDAVTKQRDALSARYDIENQKLDGLNESYSRIEETIREGQQAMEDFAAASEKAIQRQEEALRAAEEAAKNGGKIDEAGNVVDENGKKIDDAGGGQSKLAAAFEAAGTGDFETYGGTDVIGREGGSADQTKEIEDFAATTANDLGKMLGDMNPFTPLMDAWNKTTQWFRENVKPLGAPIGAMFKDIGEEIGKAFSGGEKSASASMSVMTSGINPLVASMKVIDERSGFQKFIQGAVDGWNKLWEVLVFVGEWFSKLFGPDIRSTVDQISEGFGDIFRSVGPALSGFMETLKPLGEALLPILALAFGLVVGAVEVLWEVFNGLLGPALQFIGDLLGGLIRVITGVVKIFTGAINIITGIVQMMIGLFKGLFTGDWSMFLDGFKKIWQGIKQIFGGIWNIINGTWQAIWSLFKNLGKAIWNTIWGFVKGIIDFFKTLWDVLVGHSIIPDTINSIIEWFAKLPGMILGKLAQFIFWVIGAFMELLTKIPGALLTLGGVILNIFVSAFSFLIENAPGWIGTLITFFAGIPLKLLEGLLKLGELLLGWLGSAWQWVVDNAPSKIIAFGEWINSIPGWLLDRLGDLGGLLGGWFGAAWQWLKDNGPSLLIGFGEWINSIPGWIIDRIGDLGSLLGGWIGAAFGWVVDNGPTLLLGLLQWITGIPGKILEKLGDPLKALAGYGKDMIQGLLNGAGSLLSKIGEFMLDMLPGWIKKPFEKAMGIKSPSRVFKAYGVNIGEGLIQGMAATEGDVANASLAMAAAADTATPVLGAQVDTSSVNTAMSALDAAAGAGGELAPATMGVVAGAVPTDPDAGMAEASAKLAAFSMELQTQTGLLTAAIDAQFLAMVTGVNTSFNSIYFNAAEQMNLMGAMLPASVATLGTAYLGSWVALTSQIEAEFNAMVTSVLTGQTTLNKGVLDQLVQLQSSMDQLWKHIWALINDMFVAGVDAAISEWQRMSDMMNSVTNDQIAPMFDTMGMMLTSLEDNFRATVSNIGTIWDGMKEEVAEPARFVINDVYNSGVKEAWNKVNGWLNLDPLPDFVAKFATGGPVWGKGTGTSDSIPARLSHNEHVVTAKEVQGAGGHKAIMAQRAMWAKGVPAFATGGPVDINAAPWAGGGGESNLKPAAILARRNVHKYWPEISTIGGYRAQDAYPDHPSGLALDIMIPDAGTGTDVNEWLHREMRALALNYTIWQQRYRPAGSGGSIMEDRGDPTQNHMDHVHALFNANGVPGIQDGGVGGGAFVESMRTRVDNIFKSIMDPIGAKIPGDSTGVDKIKKAAFDKFNSSVGEFLLKKADSFDATSAGAGNIAYTPSAGVEQWRQLAMDMLKKQGQSVAWTDRLLMQMATESGGNPNAINDWDENWAKGTPSKGLMQVIDPTFQSNRDPSLPNNIWDPAANIAASIRYTLATYGSLDGWQGVGYDSGGMIIPGTQVVHNQTGGPEPVLTQTQWNAMYKLSDSANILHPQDVEDAVHDALVSTGNTGNAQADAIIKGMDTWQKAWTPAMYDATGDMADAADANTKATDAAAGTTVLLSKSIGKFTEEISAFSAMMVAISNTAASGEVTFSNVSPILNALGAFIDTLPYAERDWKADNPVPGETEQQRRIRQAQNNLTNFAKGSFNVIKDVGPPLLKHVGIIGTAVEKLITEDADTWAAGMAALSMGNPMGALILVPIILKEIFTILPLIIAAILDIVPSLIRAIVRFLTQFMPDSVFAYADMAAAEEAVRNQQEGGDVAQGQGQRYPTDAMSTSSQSNKNITLNVYGDLSMPNITNGDDAQDFVDQLTLLAGNS